MSKLSRLVVLSAGLAAFATVAPASIMEPGLGGEAEARQFLPEVILAQSTPRGGYQGNWYVAPNGCAYSRTQAPGHAPMWILIQNPHHLGLPNARSNCPTTL